MLSFYVLPCFDAISDSCTFQWSKNLPKNLVCGAKITKMMYGSCLFVVTRLARWKEYFYQLSFALISAPASIFFKLVQMLTLRRSLVARRPRTLSHRFIGSVKHHKQDEAEGVLVGLVGDLAGAPHLSLRLLLRSRVNLCKVENPHLW